MATYGYARVSTTDQDLTIQMVKLAEAGCDVIRQEKATATTREGRMELHTLLDFIRPGDTLLVTRIDRLARSIGDLQDIVRELRAKGATLKATEQPINTGTAAGKAFLDMLGVFASLNQLTPREAGRGHRQSQVGRRLQRQTGDDKHGGCAGAQSPWRGRRRHSQNAINQPCQRLSRAEGVRRCIPRR